MKRERIEERLEHEVNREESSHGLHWSHMHGGYFSDLDIAHAVLDPVAEVVKKTHADAIIDMGGGTGFLLNQLADYGISSSIRLIDLDLSEAQLKQITNPLIEAVQESVLTFARLDVASNQETIVLMSRSVIHYAGFFGLKPWLKHVRQQMRKGEYFIHQSASFEKMEDSLCLNELYEFMKSKKWYPTIQVIEDAMRECGFSLESVLQAPPLELTSASLSARYNILPEKMEEIQERLGEDYGNLQGTFELGPEGFRSWLHYRVYVCRAA